jgi:hypothetical protein
MLGGSIRITPSWVPDPMTIDIEWDPASLSAAEVWGKWWGELAQLGGTGSNEGEWRWRSAQQELTLTVLVPEGGHHRHLAYLQQFQLPVTNGMTGSGNLQSSLTPTTTAPTFTWEGFAGS